MREREEESVVEMEVQHSGGLMVPTFMATELVLHSAAFDGVVAKAFGDAVKRLIDALAIRLCIYLFFKPVEPFAKATV